MPDRDMTTDKPGEVAMEAAVAVAKRYVEFAEAESETSLSLNDLAAIIQAAINEATDAVVVERDKALAKLGEPFDKVLSAVSDLGDRAAQFDLSLEELEEMQNAMQERDEARAKLATVEADLETCKSIRRLQNNQLRELVDARAAARELGEALKVGRSQVEAVCEHNERLNNGERSEMDRRDLEQIDAALTKYAALLAEPEGGR